MNLKYMTYIKSTKANIWSILTSPQGSKQIFYGAEVKSSFKEGDPITYIGPGRDGKETLHMYGTILACENHTKLKHSVIVGKAYRQDQPEYLSHITYQLEDLGFAIKLTVTHDHWDKNDPSYENTKAGWWLMLSSIKSLAETGQALDLGIHE